MNTLNGYSKSVLTDNYVLTAAGGHFPLDNTSGEALGSNTYIATLATNKSIIVEGNADTYYPVRIYMPTTKLDSTRISIWKNLRSQTASYTGNHSNGTSSLWLIYEGRNNLYDGNGGFIKMWYKSEPYAKLVAHAQQMGSGCGDLVVWLRGGGTLYNISCSQYCDVVVYLEETNLTYGSTVLTLDLKISVENGGIISNFLGYGYVEQANTLKTARTIWGQSFNGSANIESVPNFKTSGTSSFITIDTVAIKLGTKSTDRYGYNSGISFNGLFGYSNNYNNHIHAWIGLQGYVNGNSAETYNLVFAVNNSTTVNSSPTEYMRITPDGKVGIGTTTITEKLEVNGNIKATTFKGNLDWDYIQNMPPSLPPSLVGLNSEFYAPVTAGTNGQILLSTGEVPTWVNPDTLTGGAGIIYIEGTGTTAGTWLGTHNKITSYYKGLTIAYKIPIAGASTTTLNINDLGAITVKRNTSNLTTHIPVNSVIILVYDGTNFMWSDYDSTDTSTLRLYYQRFKAGTNGIKQYSLILKDADGNWQSLTTTSGTTATKTINTAKFDLSDLCHLYYASNNVASGNTTTVGYIYKVYSLADIRYSTNYTSTSGMTADKMVYIVGTIDSEGYFRLDSTWYTQTLEENIDKVYIPIGYAYDTYRIMFNGFLKPICYRNRSFVEYDPLKIHRINIGEAIYEPTYGIVTLPSSYPANGGTADKLGSTTIGSTTQPIYLNNGTPTLCTSYSGLFTALSNNNNQLSVTIGGTTKKLTIDYANTAGISNNAQLFQDMSTLPIAGDNMPWEKIVMVDNTGISDIGKELRFNYDNDATSGGTVLVCTGQYQNTISLPDKDGTIALIEDLQGLGGTTSGYWANVPISSSASNVTTPIFKTVNIGITTSTHVTNGRATLSLVTTSANPCDFWLGADNTPYWSITVRNSADSANSKGFNIYDNIAKKYRLRIFTDGSVKIGESSAQKGNLTVNGSVNALDGFFETSDSRLKNFLNEIQIDFDKLSQLPKMYFTWKSDEKEMPDLQIGTSAQELQKLYPELVRETDGHLTVAYDKLSIVALKAIDELYTMITELKKQNAKLKSKVDRLERRVYYGKKY